MKVTFVWKAPFLSDRSIADVKDEIQKRLKDLSLDWDLVAKNQHVFIKIESASHRDSLRAIYRLSHSIHTGTIQLINDRVEMLY